MLHKQLTQNELEEEKVDIRVVSSQEELLHEYIRHAELYEEKLYISHDESEEELLHKYMRHVTLHNYSRVMNGYLMNDYRISFQAQKNDLILKDNTPIQKYSMALVKYNSPILEIPSKTSKQNTKENIQAATHQAIKDSSLVKDVESNEIPGFSTMIHSFFSKKCSTCDNNNGTNNQQEMSIKSPST